jgi:hypothetical protein
MPIAASPTLSFSAPIKFDESMFTGQSPAPFSVLSTPQAYDHGVSQDGVMGVIYDGGNSDTLASVYSLACVLERQGRYRAAKQMHGQALELRREALEEPSTGATRPGQVLTQAVQLFNSRGTLGSMQKAGRDIAADQAKADKHVVEVWDSVAKWVTKLPPAPPGRVRMTKTAPPPDQYPVSVVAMHAGRPQQCLR